MQIRAGSLNRLTIPVPPPMPRPLSKYQSLNSLSLGDSRQPALVSRFKDPAQLSETMQQRSSF